MVRTQFLNSAVVFALSLLLLAPSATTLLGEESQLSPQPASASDEDLARWVVELDGADFKTRQVASQNLTAAGARAIPQLTEAAQSPQRETMTRSLEILQRFAAGDDESLKQAARAALEAVADGKNLFAARRAKLLLDPPPPKNNAQPRGGGIRIGPGGVQGIGAIQIRGAGGVRIAGGQIQIGKGSQVVTTQVNGAARTVQVVHGDDRQIVIEEDAQRVKIVVVDGVAAGKPVEKSAEAKNADELKTKNAELYEVYKKYDAYRKNGVTITGR